MEEDIIETDVLVIGGGIAGCRAAIEACDNNVKVMITTKGLFGRDCGATWMAYKAFQCWGVYPDDSLDNQVEDTLRCGWFLNNQEIVYILLAHIPDAARELLRWGVRFNMKDGSFLPIWQLGQSISRGRSITAAQWPRGPIGHNFSMVLPHVVKARKIQIMEDTFIVDLLVKDDTVIGAFGINMGTGRFTVFKAKATILATGGYHGVYKFTTANPNLTGDGQAMALRAGIDMMDFEFNQTLPCAIWPPSLAGDALPFVLITEFDARMYNDSGERFLSKWDPDKMERSTRAIISRAIFHEIRAGKGSPHGGIYTSLTHKPASFLNEKLREYKGSRIFTKFEKTSINLLEENIETGYAMHYCQGGCSINSKCETDKPGVYAIGEGAAGTNGADRMMANALPYCMAMGIISGREAAQRARTTQIPKIDDAQVDRLRRKVLAPLERQNGVRVYEVKPLLQDIMAEKTLYGRTEEGLSVALREVERYKKEVLPNLWIPNKSKKFNMEWINILEFENTVLVSECIIRNAIMRTESRGLHDRWDNPNPDPDWFKNIHLRLVDGEFTQWTVPVEFKYYRPEPATAGEPWHKAIQVKEYKGWKAEPLYERMR